MQPRQTDQKRLRQCVTGKATVEQNIQWREPAQVHTAHQRDEVDESRGVPSTSMGTVEQAGEMP